MANTLSAKKRARQSEKRRVHNVALRSRLRTSIKKTAAEVAGGEAEKAEAAFLLAVPIIDSAVNKGIIHRNKAARTKNRLNSSIRALKAI